MAVLCKGIFKCHPLTIHGLGTYRYPKVRIDVVKIDSDLLTDRMGSVNEAEDAFLLANLNYFFPGK